MKQTPVVTIDVHTTEETNPYQPHMEPLTTVVIRHRNRVYGVGVSRCNWRDISVYSAEVGFELALRRAMDTGLARGDWFNLDDGPAFSGRAVRRAIWRAWLARRSKPHDIYGSTEPVIVIRGIANQTECGAMLPLGVEPIP